MNEDYLEIQEIPGALMVNDQNKKRLLSLFMDITNKTTITQPITRKYGTLRDRDAMETEISHITSEILNRGLIQTKFSPRQIARIVIGFFDDKSDNQIARDLEGEHLSRSVGRARIRLKLFRDTDFHFPFDRAEIQGLIDQGLSLKTISDKLGISYSSFRQYYHTIQMESDSAIDLHVERIRAVMEDRDISEKMTSSALNIALDQSIESGELETIEEA
jgi:hypothetical protein